MPHLIALLTLAALAFAGPADGDPVEEEAPADEGSIWDFIESAEGAPPAPEVVQDSEELAEERIAELSITGSVGAEPPVEYYLDPLGATTRDPLHLDKVDPKEFDIPVVVNDDVKKWMTYFLTRGRKYYGRYLQRSTKWMPMMHRELEARGMPADLVYLSMIESGFTTGATSYASAAGLWQFMPATGRQYGLRVDWWVDDRRDPEKATVAALQYLAYLNRMFAGDWWLSWASYNGGEGRVMKTTQRLGTTDFWAIVARHSLHPETENYVPKLLAAAIIGKHPERYGFVGLKYEPEFAFDAVEVPGSTSVDVLARCAGISEEDFLSLNPALRRWALPPDPELQRIRLPVGTKDVFSEAFAKVPPAERITFVEHTVKKGESVGSIAKKYGISSDDIVRLNHIKNKNRVSVGTVLLLPGKGPPGESIPLGEVGEKPAAPAENSGKTAEKTASNEKSDAVAPVKTTYKVRGGDTLGAIASKYGTSVSQLQKWNGIRGNHIEVGQKLVVKVTAGKAPEAAAPKVDAKVAAKPSEKPVEKSATKPPAKSSTYIVRKGDTLGSIADKHDVSIADLKAWNGIKGTTIYPGQKLKIKG